jgi:endonuclease YncB( thermonuclease family)
MRRKLSIAGFLGLLILGAGGLPARAGDSLYGKVTAVKSGDVVTFDYGSGQYVLRLVGIEAAKEGPLAAKAVRLVRRMVLGKNARMRFEGLGEDGLMRSRLFTGNPAQGVKEVAQELVRAGLARRQKGFDFKYGELATAENEARSARRGLWSAVQPR